MRGLLEKLKKGEVLMGFNLMYPAPGIVERIGVDWDFVWIDAQHGEHDYNSLLASVRAADFVGIDSLVRVPSHDPGWIGRALDMAPSGIIVPQVDTKEQAERIVKAAKFPPVGSRSYGGRRPIDLYARAYSHTANDELALVVQIESQTAVENVEDIFSVEGVDACYYGPDDMAMGIGLPMDQPRPLDKFQDAMKRIMVAARSYGVAGGGSFAAPESLANAVSLGFQLIGIGGDVKFLAEASKAHRQKMSEALKKGEAGASQEVDSSY